MASDKTVMSAIQLSIGLNYLHFFVNISSSPERDTQIFFVGMNDQSLRRLTHYKFCLNKTLLTEGGWSSEKKKRTFTERKKDSESSVHYKEEENLAHRHENLSI